jgi:hypothetical protein
LGGATKKIHDHSNRLQQDRTLSKLSSVPLHAKTSIQPTTTFSLRSQSATAIMSEGEVEVGNTAAYEVLPKEVLAEVGSVKLFSTFDPVHPRKK